MKIEEVAKKIKVPVNKWAGNCYSIACKMTQSGIVKGRSRYGVWLGPIEEGSMFEGRPFARHGWIVPSFPDKVGGEIVDPTRWVFEQVTPYIYIGLSDHYDPGMRMLRQGLRAPVSHTGEVVRLDVEQDTIRALLELAESEGSELLMGELFWLANSPPEMLGEIAMEFYMALERMGRGALIPIDFYSDVIGD